MLVVLSLSVPPCVISMFRCSVSLLVVVFSMCPVGCFCVVLVWMSVLAIAFLSFLVFYFGRFVFFHFVCKFYFLSLCSLYPDSYQLLLITHLFSFNCLCVCVYTAQSSSCSLLICTVVFACWHAFPGCSSLLLISFGLFVFS